MRILTTLVIALACAHQMTASEVRFPIDDGELAIEFVTVGDEGNPPDQPDKHEVRLGSVDYEFSISKYETSWGEYAEVLQRDLGGENPQLPARGESRNGAAMFANALNASLGYPPAYRIDNINVREWAEDDPGYNPDHPWRSSLARFVLPSDDEFHKSAYFDPVKEIYYNLATSTDESISVVDEPSTDPFVWVALTPGNFVPVREAGGESPFGTVGQSGSIDEHVDFSRTRIEGEIVAYFGNVKAGGTEDLASKGFVDGDGGFRIVDLLDRVSADFTQDRVIDAMDLDLLSEQVRSPAFDASFDLNGDGVVDTGDRLYWISDFAETFVGDSDLNGEVAFNDFLAVANNFDQPTGWAGGDFDGNGMTDFQDFLVLANNFGKTSESNVASVPESCSSLSVIFAIAPLLLTRRRACV